MADNYICGVCGQEFEKTPEYEETALQEMKERFGEVPESQRAIVCHDCWEKAETVGGKLDAEHFRLMTVIGDMRKRGYKVVGVVGIDNKNHQLEVTWGTSEKGTVEALIALLGEALKQPLERLCPQTAEVTPKGVVWEDKPWVEIN